MEFFGIDAAADTVTGIEDEEGKIVVFGLVTSGEAGDAGADNY